MPLNDNDTSLSYDDMHYSTVTYAVDFPAVGLEVLKTCDMHYDREDLLFELLLEHYEHSNSGSDYATSVFENIMYFCGYQEESIEGKDVVQQLVDETGRILTDNGIEKQDVIKHSLFHKTLYIELIN